MFRYRQDAVSSKATIRITLPTHPIAAHPAPVAAPSPLATTVVVVKGYAREELTRSYRQPAWWDRLAGTPPDMRQVGTVRRRARRRRTRRATKREKGVVVPFDYGEDSIIFFYSIFSMVVLYSTASGRRI